VNKFLANDSINASIRRNLAILFFWWIVFFPGFFSADSLSVLNMAKTGKLSNAYTASWSLYVEFSLFKVDI